LSERVCHQCDAYHGEGPGQDSGQPALAIVARQALVLIAMPREKVPRVAFGAERSDISTLAVTRPVFDVDIPVALTCADKARTCGRPESARINKT